MPMPWHSCLGCLPYLLARLVLLLSLVGAVVEAKASKDEKASKANYVPGQAIPVSCLNRTMYDLSKIPSLLMACSHFN